MWINVECLMYEANSDITANNQSHFSLSSKD